MKKNLVLLCVVCLFCTSCKHIPKTAGDKLEVEGLIKIDIMTNLLTVQKMNLSTVASNIEYCLLETDKKCLVSPDDAFYASDEFVVTIGRGHYYVFNRKTGNYIRQISGEGRGPGEYSESCPLFWDPQNEQVCMFGNNQYIFYKIDGTISHYTKRFNHYMDRFVPYDDYYVGYVPNKLGNSAIRIAFYDKTGYLIDSIPNYKLWKRAKSSRSSSDSWLYVFNNNLYYIDLYCDTLYRIKDFTLHPRYVFNTDGRTVPYEIQGGGRYEIQSIDNKNVLIDRYEQYVCIAYVHESNKYLYIGFMYRQKGYRAIYDKVEDNLQIVPNGFENDLDGGLPFWPRQMNSEKEMMCVYPAEELLKLDVSKISDPKLKNVLGQLTEDSNPVVAIVTLKD